LDAVLLDRRSVLPWALVLAVLGGCAPEREAELLSVRTVAPERIEPGHTLRVRGDGFPPGRPARIRLEGVAHRPGHAPRSVGAELRGRALSSDRIEASFTEEALEALGGRGTLRGRAIVLFDATPEGAVVGRSPAIVLDVSPASTSRLNEELARTRAAIEAVTSLGLSLGEESPDETGLPIEAIEEGSPAARAGLVVGDRLIALDGVRLHELSDFVASPTEDRPQIEVAREGEAAPFAVRIAITRHTAIAPRSLRGGQAALGWVLAVLLLVAPTASVLDRLAERPGARAQGERRGLLRRARSFAAPILRALIGAAFFVAIALLAHAHLLRVPLETLALGVLAARTSAAYMAAQGSVRARLRAACAAFALAVPAALAIGIVCASAGTTDLEALHARAGTTPWEWTALRSPAGPFVLALLVLGGAWRAPSGGAQRGDGIAARFAGLVDEIVALTLAAVGGIVLFGGWSCEIERDSLERVVGPVLFAVKALALWIAMRRIGASSPRLSAVGILARMGIAACAIALTLAWGAWREAPELETALAEVLAAALACAAMFFLARRIVHGRPSPLAPPHPFS
jgi:hypothetical protein